MDFKEYLNERLNVAIKERNSYPYDSSLYAYYDGKVTAFKSALVLFDMCKK